MIKPYELTNELVIAHFKSYMDDHCDHTEHYRADFELDDRRQIKNHVIAIIDNVISDTAYWLDDEGSYTDLIDEDKLIDEMEYLIFDC